MHVPEENVVRQRHHRREAKKSKEIDSAGREKLMSVRSAVARVAIDDASREKQPGQQINDAGCKNRGRAGFAIEKGAEVVKHCRKADDIQSERASDVAGLCG